MKGHVVSGSWDFSESRTGAGEGAGGAVAEVGIFEASIGRRCRGCLEKLDRRRHKKGEDAQLTGS